VHDLVVNDGNEQFFVSLLDFFTATVGHPQSLLLSGIGLSNGLRWHMRVSSLYQWRHVGS
jgi:hypothetical protein